MKTPCSFGRTVAAALASSGVAVAALGLAASEVPAPSPGFPWP